MNRKNSGSSGVVQEKAKPFWAKLLKRASMEKSDPEIEALWDQESLRRYNAYKQKRVKAKDLNEVLRTYE